MESDTVAGVPLPPEDGAEALDRILDTGVVWGDAAQWLQRLPAKSVDLFFTSPPYADARAYSRIHPDNYVEWFLPFAAAMLEATSSTGSFVLNIKNRVAKSGELQGQRHPYVYELVLAVQRMGWRWVETYIWTKPNAIPGRFGPRTKDSFEYVYHFAKGPKPFFDLDAVRVPYKTGPAEIARRLGDAGGRKNTDAGFGRDRTKTYGCGGADPGNVIAVSQSYNQHHGPAGRHTAVMPEGPGGVLREGGLPTRRGRHGSVRRIGYHDGRGASSRTSSRRHRIARGIRCRGNRTTRRRLLTGGVGTAPCRFLTRSAPMPWPMLLSPRRGGPIPSQPCTTFSTSRTSTRSGALRPEGSAREIALHSRTLG